jgi:LysM repeat protein
MNTVFAEYDEYQLLSVTVEEGDTLWEIARVHNQDVGMSIQDYIYKIRSLNEMDSVMIYPGQTIQIITNHES